ncbi:MAG: hypothetical protein RLZZ436_2360, partial [Planctomycetota bacterium]
FASVFAAQWGSKKRSRQGCGSAGASPSRHCVLPESQCHWAPARRLICGGSPELRFTPKCARRQQRVARALYPQAAARRLMCGGSPRLRFGTLVRVLPAASASRARALYPRAPARRLIAFSHRVFHSRFPLAFPPRRLNPTASLRTARAANTHVLNPAVPASVRHCDRSPPAAPAETGPSLPDQRKISQSLLHLRTGFETCRRRESKRGPPAVQSR